MVDNGGHDAIGAGSEGGTRTVLEHGGGDVGVDDEAVGVGISDEANEAKDLLEFGRAFLQQHAGSDCEEGGSDAGPAARKRGRLGILHEDAWQQFTPKVIEERLCMARVRNLGKGGQCRRSRLPARELCLAHCMQKRLKYGRVDGPIPENELRWLLRDAQAREEKTIASLLRTKAAIDDGKLPMQVEAASVAVVAQPSRLDRHWYTRALMWRFALQEYDAVHGGQLGSISELAPEEYRCCLDKVNRYLKKNKVLREIDRQDLVNKDRGPAAASDQGKGRYVLESVSEGALEDYNGVGGGLVHQYYQSEI
jgi:hypothetical protein